MAADVNHDGDAELRRARALYLDLLKRTLTRTGFEPSPQEAASGASRIRAFLFHGLRLLFRWLGWELVDPKDRTSRMEGRDWPSEAETMIGWTRLAHLERCVTDVLTDRVPGDLLEAGVWRGGASILMRGVLEVYGDQERAVWVADSFRGLPRPSIRELRGDIGDVYWTFGQLAVSQQEVRANFERYGLLDERVVFLEGWFSETLPGAPVDRLALLRIDADMYDSTRDALHALYPKLCVGGYVVIDDYGAVPACRKAVDEFREEQRIRAPIEWIDWTGVCWRRVPEDGAPGSDQQS